MANFIPQAKVQILYFLLLFISALRAALAISFIVLWPIIELIEDAFGECMVRWKLAALELSNYHHEPKVTSWWSAHIRFIMLPIYSACLWYKWAFLQSCAWFQTAFYFPYCRLYSGTNYQLRLIERFHLDMAHFSSYM